MTHPAKSTSTPLRGLAASIALSLVALAFTAYIAWGDTARTVSRDKMLKSVAGASDLGSVLPLELVTYAAMLVLVYVVLGLVTHGLVLATESAVGRTPARRALHAGAWLVALHAWALLANAALYPASEFATAPWTVATLALGGVRVIDAVSLLLSFAIVAAVATGTWRWLRNASRHRAVVIGLASAFAVASCAALVHRPDATATPTAAATSTARPHVILIGIDSLRCDTTSLGSGPSLTPNIDRFLAQSTVFPDAISPLARTFPAWVSILTGRHPATTNARFNLMPRAAVVEGDTLGDQLRAAGYRSVYATDEVRFANIDQSYGFDQLITPPIGAGDFVLGTLNDLPATNLLSGTWLGAALFPHTYANRAASVTYRPDRFVGRIERELRVDGPTFLTVHLTLAHWPYSWAGVEEPTTPPAYRDAYGHSVAAVDRQFAALMATLGAKGLLDNAIVVLLSDHGEALGRPQDSYVRGFAGAQELWNSLWGHGTSVVSPHQFTVMLAFSRFGPEPLPAAGERPSAPASLEDVRPTVLDIVLGHPGEGLDGRSLRAVLEGQPAGSLDERVRFTETDFNTQMVLKGQFDKDGILKEGAEYYEVDPASGWLQLRADRIPELVPRKERAALSRTHLLAAIPRRDRPEIEYILIQRGKGLPQRVTERPAASTEAARLWDALHARFDGEL